MEGVLHGLLWAISGLFGIAIGEFSDGGLVEHQPAVLGKNVLTRDEIAIYGVLLCVQPAVV